MFIQTTGQLFRLIYVQLKNDGYLQMAWATIFNICLLSVMLISQVSAQSLPNHIRIIIPFAPGGPTDVMGRLAAESLAQHTKSTVINENRPGANGLVGVNFIKQGPVDGSNLLFVSSGMITFSPLLDKSLSYDPQKDLVPIICLAQTDIGIIVANQVPVNNLKELVALGKSPSSTLSFGSAGHGNILHAYIELLKDATKIHLLHVPYKGASPSFTDVLGGQISGMFISVALAEQAVKSGKVKLLALVGKRNSSFPDVPTITEQGFPGVDTLPWFAIMGPRGMTTETVQLVANSIAPGGDEELKRKITTAGSSPLLLTGAPFAQLIKNESAMWSKLITDKKIALP